MSAHFRALTSSGLLQGIEGLIVQREIEGVVGEVGTLWNVVAPTLHATFKGGDVTTIDDSDQLH